MGEQDQGGGHSPLRLPRFLLEPIVHGLRDGGLHEVDVAHDLRCKHVAQVLVELALAQALCSHATKWPPSLNNMSINKMAALM